MELSKADKDTLDLIEDEVEESIENNKRKSKLQNLGSEEIVDDVSSLKHQDTNKEDTKKP